MRRHVAERLGQLEAAAQDRRAALGPAPSDADTDADADGPSLDDIEAVLAGMPVFSSELLSLPQRELRMFPAHLNLDVTFHHETRRAEIRVTLWRDRREADGDESDRPALASPSSRRTNEEVCIAPSAIAPSAGAGGDLLRNSLRSVTVQGYCHRSEPRRALGGR